MTLSKTRWIVRLFFWSLGILDAFTEGDRVYRVEKYGTNLCTFVQTTFVLAPAVLLLNVVVYAAMFTALTIGPIAVLGVGTFAASVGGLAALVLLVIGANEYVERRDERRRQRRYEFTPDAGPTSLGIVWQWVVAQKQKVCPMISFQSGART